MKHLILGVVLHKAGGLERQQHACGKHFVHSSACSAQRRCPDSATPAGGLPFKGKARGPNSAAHAGRAGAAREVDAVVVAQALRRIRYSRWCEHARGCGGPLLSRSLGAESCF
eukprot:229380-Prymnesium_polylepis.1